MRLTNLRLVNFRNHRETQLSFGHGANIFFGDNGEGKTNVLEAISYLCLTKSFYAGNDRFALQLGKDFFAVEGEMLSDRDTGFAVRVLYNQGSAEKKFWINKAEADTFSAVIGKFPVVILSPEGGAITFGPPADRRKFVDLVISQASKMYLENLMEYRRVLKQRNRILLNARAARQDGAELLEPWDGALIELGTQLILKRGDFIREFAHHVGDAFQRVIGESETPSIRYASSADVSKESTAEEIQEQFRHQLDERQAEERRTGTTLVGPHRDEFEFAINGLELRKFASQGQHKTFLVALKMAEFFYLKEQCTETPLLLLDDVFSELDEYRTERVLNLVQELGQAFITSTNDQVFPAGFGWGSTKKKFFVRQGTVKHEEAGNLVH